MKSRLLSGLALVLLCLFSAGALAAPGFSVILPEGYEAGEMRYPVAYILPQDGYTQDDSGIAEKLSAASQMILVLPTFEDGCDAIEEMAALQAQIDAEYRTIADARHRALIGTGAGGYLAYAIGLADDSPFGALVSIRGNFSDPDNPWLGLYGPAADRIETLQAIRGDGLSSLYTYLDTPVSDPWANMPGSTNDIGALFIGFGTASAAHEYTARPGAFTDAFLSESVARAADRLAAYMAEETEAAAQEESEEAALPPAVWSAEPPSVIDGDYQMIDLSGGWRFQYAGQKAFDPASLTEEMTADWPVVHPGLGNWTDGYGNISSENVSSGYGPDYFDYFIIGNGYYVCPFILPQEFDVQEVMLSIGYVDDRCEAFVNGQRVGATGLDDAGRPTGETTWAQYSRFDVDAALLRPGEMNVIVLRAWNDMPYGAGGWYGGPVGLYSREAFVREIGFGAAGEHERFYEETFLSRHAASALGEKGPIENKYLIYLPESYFEQPDRYYPTCYLLHQFNSDHTSYKADKIDSLLDAGVASGAFDEMIVVIPNSEGNSWWTGAWEAMITEELIPLVDSQYRTIEDPRFRMTAGCSMGGQGAMAVALRNPAFFSGVASFYGAFSYGGSSSPNAIAARESAEYLSAFSLYFICGNQDSYGFGVPAIELNQQLEKLGVDHGFLIDNGGHDSSFYTPYFSEVMGRVRAGMYAAGGMQSDLLSGQAAQDGTTVSVRIAAEEALREYLYTIPDSSYTPKEQPALLATLILEIGQEGSVHTLMQRSVPLEPGAETEVVFDAAEAIDPTLPCSLALKVSVLGQTFELTAAE